ncbi:ferrochelatase [Bdellovibrio sp. qaytius]|nr:ferrochelatase [Bdellovibrio sp. qaytius]
MRKLLILSQIGSPSAPTARATGQYLARFLMDKRILDIPWFFRAILVYIGIVPRRSKPSAEKYQSIWTLEGSPLVVETTKFAKLLALKLPDTDVVIHWRYGEKSVEATLKDYKAKKYDEILIAPMYPQFAMATTGSSLDVLLPAIEQAWPKHENVKTLKPFYNNESFLSSWVDQIKPYVQNNEHLLISFHGLPVSQIQKNPGCELNQKCCERPDISRCYYAQCQQTVNLIAKKLNLPQDRYTLSFQSKVGPKKWLEPATEKTTEALVKEKSVKSLVVACPAFVTDGLETLEEINMELHHRFQQWGGQKFMMVPSLNDNANWITGFAKMVNDVNWWTKT